MFFVFRKKLFKLMEKFIENLLKIFEK